MCADYKIHVNDKIKSDAYPIPNIETIFANLSQAKVFAKLDLKSAYWQIELDNHAKAVSVINTCKGLYQVNRLQMGMKNASAIFQRTIESILAGISNILIYQDDIAIYAENMDELGKIIANVKQRLNQRQVTLNDKKSVEFCKEITFLGFKISEAGIEPDTRLVEKIKAIKAPTNRKELEHFLGLINYFGRLIPKFSNKCKPLNNLRNQSTSFAWTDECQMAFDERIDEISSYPVVQPYDLHKEVTLTTDASKSAIGAVLTQDHMPVIYVSRSLNKAEQNYSNIEREALAITWAVLRLKQFLLGRKFTIQTDHKPLEYIFKQNAALPNGTSARIFRWVIELMPYDYSIKYIPGKIITHADALTRLKFNDYPSKDDGEISKIINYVNFEKSIIDHNLIVSETSKDRILQQIINRIRNNNWSNCSQAERAYKACKDQLSIYENVIYKGNTVVLPKILIEKAFEICHIPAHSGIRSNINRIQHSTWWPGMHKDIARLTQQCHICQQLRHNGEKSVNHWPSCNPFERLHMDWAYVKDVGNILIIIDASTGWIEAFHSQDRTTEFVIKCLRAVFTRFGIPCTVVSDNAKEFISDRINQWLKCQGVQKIESPIYFPKANGVAERAVQTVKNALKAWKFNTVHSDFTTFLQKVLLHNRISSHNKGKSPAELVFGRKLRIPITTTFQQGQELWFKPHKNAESKKYTYVMSKGENTSWIEGDNSIVLASNSQLSPCNAPGTNVEPVTDTTSSHKINSDYNCLSSQLLNDSFSGNDKSNDIDSLRNSIVDDVITTNQSDNAVLEVPAANSNTTLRRSTRNTCQVKKYGFD